MSAEIHLCLAKSESASFAERVLRCARSAFGNEDDIELYSFWSDTTKSVFREGITDGGFFPVLRLERMTVAVQAAMS